MEIKINKNNDAHLEIYRIAAKNLALKSRIKARILYKRLKTLFIGVVTLLIITGLIITPKAETNASESLSVEEKTFTIIAKYEGYSSVPYWDKKQWSCGYGMRCFKTTTGITKEKSKWYVIQRIKSIRERYDLYKYDDNLEAALISFIYNIGHPPLGYERYIKNGYMNGLKNRMKEYIYAGDQKLGGLVKRRSFETGLF